MGKSIRYYQKENEGYYGGKWFVSISRRFWFPAIFFPAVWIGQLLLLKFSCDISYYYQLARAGQAEIIELKTWVNQQALQNLLDWRLLISGIIMILMVVTHIFLWYFFKSYELYKHMKLIKYLPIVFFGGSYAFIIVASVLRSGHVLIRQLFVALGSVFTYLSMFRSVLPLDVKKENFWWKFVDLAGKLLSKL